MRSPLRSVSSLMIIDAAVPDRQVLIEAVKAGIEVFLLNAQQDGVVQITEVLASRRNLKSLHIVSHGNQGSLSLGQIQLTASTLDTYSWDLQAWGDALAPNADVLLYGCNVANGESGQAFVQKLGLLMRANVAASSNPTGSAALGGDWVLEFATGNINTPLGFKPEVEKQYAAVLATFTVTNTDDSGTGSLRQAITDANAASGTDTIVFSIPQGGVKTINLLSALPNVTGTVVIDGFSQGGVDYDGPPLIELNGAGVTSTSNGLTLASGSQGSTIKGLIINRFKGKGILVEGSNTTISGNYIGTDSSGSGALGNGTIQEVTALVFGSPVGTFTAPVGDGIYVASSSNIITSNRIAFNLGSGIAVPTGSNNRIQGNNIFSNLLLGIDIGRFTSNGFVVTAAQFPNGVPDGVTANDSGDGDGGANRLQNYPVITSAVTSNGDTTISGSLNSTANTTFTLEFFSNASLDFSGASEGQTSLGTLEVTTNGSGNASFTFDAASAIAAGQWVTALATNKSNNDTSEFSAKYQVTTPNTPPTFVEGIDLSLPGIVENAANVNNSGIRVADLIEGAISDVNGNPRGIAVTALDPRKGTWQYSRNGGKSWTNFSASTSVTSATLLLGETVLYDPTRDGAPDTQGWLVLPNLDLEAPVGAAQETVGSNGTTLNTAVGSDNTIYAGYSSHTVSLPTPAQVQAGTKPTAVSVNSALPTLERTTGYSLVFDLKMLSEFSTRDERAGFSVILVSSDKKAIELGFSLTSNRIYALGDGQTAPPQGAPDSDTLFEDEEFVEYDTTQQTTYRLTVQGNTYQLFANDTQILTGPLRDYSAFDNLLDPYETPNFVFLGDDTTSARGEFVLGRVALQTENRVRFLPNSNFNGTANLGIRAWDGTRGTNGATSVNTTKGGSTSAFSIEIKNMATADNDGKQLEGTASNETLTGTAFADVLRGRGGNDQLLGLEGDDDLRGNAGNDILLGGAGDDTLQGGLGIDRFQFALPTDGIDTIVGFSVTEDKIRISKQGFGAGLVNGAITADQFRVGGVAQDAGDRFLYKRKTGALFFDADGSGAGSAIQIAQLSSGLDLTRFNIVVIN